MRFLLKVGNVLMFGAFLVAAISGLMIANEALLVHPLGFLAFWGFVPFVSWWLTLGSAGDPWPPRYILTGNALRVVSAFLVASSCLLSLLIFLNWESIRDTVGKRYVQGYYATHNSLVFADHWYAERGIWLLEVTMVFGSFAFPVLTLVAAQKALDSRQTHEAVFRLRSSSGTSPSTLLYDGFDDPGLAELLESWGLSVLHVPDVSDVALELKSRGFDFDLIVLDSWDSHIRAHIDAFLPFAENILFLDFEGQYQAFLASKGYAHVVDKPVAPEKLREHVQQILGEKRLKAFS